MNEKYRTIIGAVVVFAVLGAIFLLESRKPERPVAVGNGAQDISLELDTMTKEQKAKRYETAKEISSPDGFVNTDGITVGELIGKKVILVDFWTYSCVNCQRTIPHLNSWHEKYADDGLVIIGMHTPEFDFEKDYDNVTRAVDKWEIKYPVVLDNDYSTWMSYKNRYWPRKYLIDVDGFIVYDHIGEGGYEETEKKIVEALNELHEREGMGGVVLDETPVKEVDEVSHGKVGTPETYLGASRVQYLANLPHTGCLNGVCTFTPSGEIQLNTFELSGEWRIENEEATLSGDGGALFLRFSANKVNLVAGALKDVKAEIYLDGELVNGGAGEHVKDGVVTFMEHDLYNLIDLGGKYGEHTVEIRFQDGGVSAFAFTFG